MGLRNKCCCEKGIRKKQMCCGASNHSLSENGAAGQGHLRSADGLDVRDTITGRISYLESAPTASTSLFFFFKKKKKSGFPPSQAHGPSRASGCGERQTVCYAQPPTQGSQRVAFVRSKVVASGVERTRRHVRGEHLQSKVPLRTRRLLGASESGERASLS